MTYIRSLSKFVLEMFPLVLATVISAVLVSALHLTAGAMGEAAQAQRSAPGAADPIVYVDVMPRINRDPATTVAALTPPAATETPAPVETPATAAVIPAPVVDFSIPVKPVPPPQMAAVPPVRERTARTIVATRVNASVTPKTEPAVRIEPVSTLPPPMPIVSADLRNAAPEPTRIFGMTVPPSVVQVGGKVVDAARFPIEVAEVAVPSPVIRVGLKIVEKVAGAAGDMIVGR